MTNNEMPDEIYAWMGIQDNGSWDHKPCPCCKSEKYTRTDLVIRKDDPVLDRVEEVLKKVYSARCIQRLGIQSCVLDAMDGVAEPLAELQKLRGRG